MNKCYWIIDELLTERHDGLSYGFPSLADAAEELGHRVFRTKHKPFLDHPFPDGVPFESGSCAVVHGTVEFCKAFERHYGRHHTPGLYFNKHVKNFYRYAHHYGTHLLNRKFIILPYGQVLKRYVPVQEHFFIKPEDGMKEFTGQVIRETDDLFKLTPYGELWPETLCIVAPSHDILAEFRYVIVERKVITGSEYRWDNVLDVRTDTHPICDALANSIAIHDYQPDSVYVADIALIKYAGQDSARLIEFNAFSSSGLYACDTRKIVKAVSKAAEDEHSGVCD